MSLLLVPGSADDWVLAGDNQRRFPEISGRRLRVSGQPRRRSGHLPDLLVVFAHGRLSNQAQATQTARASLLALMAPQAQASARRPWPSLRPWRVAAACDHCGPCCAAAACRRRQPVAPGLFTLRRG